METRPHPAEVDEPASAARLDAASALGALRTLVGVASWSSPALAWRTFGLGVLTQDPRSALATRLFAVRDLALGLAVRHRTADVRRAALQVGVAVDAIDVAASILSLRKGAPKGSGLGVGGGAALFCGLGLIALTQGDDRRR